MVQGIGVLKEETIPNEDVFAKGDRKGIFLKNKLKYGDGPVILPEIIGVIKVAGKHQNSGGCQLAHHSIKASIPVDI